MERVDPVENAFPMNPKNIPHREGNFQWIYPSEGVDKIWVGRTPQMMNI